MGDHDPSGLDIERFLNDAFGHFGIEARFERIALAYNQVMELKLPPNPTKKADSRAGGYIEQYGDCCWELDAIEPKQLQRIVRDTILRNMDVEVWNDVIEANEEARKKVESIQRASQLVADYGFQILDLKDFFSWKDYETCFRYARKGWRGLASKYGKV